MHYSVCANALFPGIPVHEALPLIREAGYSHYEFWGWWDQDIDTLCHVQREQCMTSVALCTRFITLTNPVEHLKYSMGLLSTIQVARRLGCASIISQVGQEEPGISREKQHEYIVTALRALVGSLIPKFDLPSATLLIEPLNTQIDHPGYFLFNSEEAFRIVKEVGSPYVKVLYDAYHQHIMGEDTPRVIADNIDKIGHIHMASFPGRHEPTAVDNEIDVGAILDALARGGYDKAVGLEFTPNGNQLAALQAIRERWPLG